MCMMYRYPEKIKQSMHRARCILPMAIAKVLRQQPQLVAPAVELFYGHDAAQLKACGRSKAFPQVPSLNTTVSFNRVQYAKLASQNLPPTAGYSLPPTQSSEFKASCLGMKLHVLMTLSVFSFRRNTRKRSSVGSFTRDAGMSFAEAMAQTADASFESDAGASDDDDSWLSLHPDELDALMQKAGSVLKDVSQDDTDSQTMSIDEQDAARSLRGMLDSFESFLVADSGVEGAELGSDESDGNEYSESIDEDVDLDASEIIDALMKAVGAGEMGREFKSETSRDDKHKAENYDESDIKGRRSEREDNGQGADAHISLETVMNAMDRELGESKVG
ncbi:hypothetical protein LPJ59_004581, partial [Coemansia sp. RSA 2399]